MNESRFTRESIAECIAAAERNAERGGSLHGTKHARLAKSMRSALRKANESTPYIYFRFPSHRIEREYHGYTVG